MRARPWLAAIGLGAVALAAQLAVTRSTAGEEAPPPALVEQGGSLFAQMCSHCHGVHMVNPGTSSFDLRKFPHEQRERFFNSVTHGKGNMPAWGDILKPEEIEALWAYVRTGGKT